MHCHFRNLIQRKPFTRIAVQPVHRSVGKESREFLYALWRVPIKHRRDFRRLLLFRNAAHPLPDIFSGLPPRHRIREHLLYLPREWVAAQHGIFQQLHSLRNPVSAFGIDLRQFCREPAEQTFAAECTRKRRQSANRRLPEKCLQHFLELRHVFEVFQ